MVAVALPVALLPARTAHAAELTLSGGRMDWGIRSSFLTYVTGPVAQGSWSLSGGAGSIGSGRFRFHSAQGTYDPDTGTVRARYTGGVHFVGHREDSGEYQLDLTISNPSVSLANGSGTLHADVRSRDRDTGRVTQSSQVALASLALGGVDLRGGSQIVLTNVPATLTAEGARAFAGYYNAGDPLDPVSLTADAVTPAADPTPEPPAREPEPEDAREEDAEDAREEDTGAELHDAIVDWGVRRTFREFVTGPIAEGSWTLGDGALDGGALFRFPDGRGELDAEAGTARAAFAGALHFTGNDLDLRLEAPTVEIADGTGTLSADVTTDDGETRTLSVVTFEAPELAVEDDLVLFFEVPTVLTEEGAAIFGGLYAPETEMDPITVALALSEEADLPALPDLGSEPPAEEPAAEPEPAAAPEPEPAASDTDSGLPTIPLLVGAALLLSLLAAGIPLWRRRRRSAEPVGTAGDGDPEGSDPTGTDGNGAAERDDAAPVTARQDPGSPAGEPAPDAPAR
ncbi:Htaa domain protein [Streptomyces sp. IF17]|nr:HtaA domain-containing protein [Streptomyces alkaliphilus]MQS09198.1 Htaa domain protein [Streptomyces alkaliphilus]